MYLVQSATLDVAGGGDSGSFDRYAGTQWTTPTNTWVHVALTWNVMLRLYVGGVMVAEETNPGRSYDGGDVFIGSDFDNGSLIAHVAGSIDDVFLFSRELSAAEITLLAAP